MALPSDFIPHQIRLGYLLHSDSNEFKFKVIKSKSKINKIISKFNNPYIAVSGGKDSMAMLHLIYSIKRNIWVRHYDWGRALIPASIQNDILKGINSIVNNNYLSIGEWQKGHTEEGRHSHIFKTPFFKDLQKEIINKNWDHCFLGLRSGESNKRKARIKSSDKYFEIEPRRDKLTSTSFPISDWNANDVWAYVCKHNIQVPEIYKLMAKINGGWDKARLSTFFDDEFEGLGNKEFSNVYLWKERYKYN